MKIKDLMQERGISKSELCRQANISRPTLDNLLSDNARFTPSLSTIQKVCKALCIDWKDYV